MRTCQKKYANNARLPSVHTSVWLTSSEIRRRVIVPPTAMQQRHWTIHGTNPYIRWFQPLCATRFTWNYNASSGLTKQLLVVIQALEVIEAESSDKIITLKSKWLTFLRRLGDFYSIFALAVALRLFELTDRLSWQESNAHEFPMPKSFFAAKYFEVVDKWRMNDWTNAYVTKIYPMHVFVAVELL